MTMLLVDKLRCDEEADWTEPDPVIECLTEGIVCYEKIANVDAGLDQHPAGSLLAGPATDLIEPLLETFFTVGLKYKLPSLDKHFGYFEEVGSPQKVQCSMAIVLFQFWVKTAW